MPVQYSTLGLNKQLNDIVIAGTHDAGISSGGGAAKTQHLNIGEQAAAGVRIFDLRIAAVAVGANRITGDVELKAYHGGLMKARGGTRNIRGAMAQMRETVKVATPAAGTQMGQDLISMLREALGFVSSNAGGQEFLILKFDKCTNWSVIAQLCQEELKRVIYKSNANTPANINVATLGQLAGKVVVVFSTKGYDEAAAALGAQNMDGIFKFKNLSAGGAYQANFPGLQYYGKGGTSVVGTERNESKIKQNIKKQSGLMAEAAQLDPQVVRMMYWTTTGSIWNIEKRDKEMWNQANLYRFHKLWAGGLKQYYKGRIPNLAPTANALAGAQNLKKVTPNIVMIDFADEAKCTVIRQLNDMPITDLASLYQQIDANTLANAQAIATAANNR